MGGVEEGQGKQGCAGGGWTLDRRLRSRPEEPALQGLEQDVFGELLPTAGAGGGNTEVAW